MVFALLALLVWNSWNDRNGRCFSANNWERWNCENELGCCVCVCSLGSDSFLLLISSMRPMCFWDHMELELIMSDDDLRLRTIPKVMFDRTRLNSIVIPSSRRILGNDYFGSCELLKWVTLESISELMWIGNKDLALLFDWEAVNSVTFQQILRFVGIKKGIQAKWNFSLSYIWTRVAVHASWNECFQWKWIKEYCHCIISWRAWPRLFCPLSHTESSCIWINVVRSENWGGTFS
jgi:hypothetical protein